MNEDNIEYSPKDSNLFKSIQDMLAGPVERPKSKSEGVRASRNTLIGLIGRETTNASEVITEIEKKFGDIEQQIKAYQASLSEQYHKLLINQAENNDPIKAIEKLSAELSKHKSILSNYFELRSLTTPQENVKNAELALSKLQDLIDQYTAWESRK